MRHTDSYTHSDAYGHAHANGHARLGHTDWAKWSTIWRDSQLLLADSSHCQLRIGAHVRVVIVLSQFQGRKSRFRGGTYLCKCQGGVCGGRSDSCLRLAGGPAGGPPRGRRCCRGPQWRCAGPTQIHPQGYRQRWGRADAAGRPMSPRMSAAAARSGHSSDLNVLRRKGTAVAPCALSPKPAWSWLGFVCWAA